MVRETLIEVKTMHYSELRYHITRSGRDAGKRPVERRAAGLQKEYDTALAATDRRWCGTPADTVGPMRAVLQGHAKDAAPGSSIWLCGRGQRGRAPADIDYGLCERGDAVGPRAP